MRGNISPITDRRDINVGHFCNQRCKFCYYRQDLNSLNFSLQRIKRRLRLYRRYGVNKLYWRRTAFT